jgi:phosphohistidine phosphatase
MNLYLLRHAIAADRVAAVGSSDALRPLTREGIQKLRKVTRAMKAMEMTFDAILTSPYVRALQTAQQVAADLRYPGVLHKAGALQPGGRPADLVRFIRSIKSSSQNILLVGHEPDLGELTALLVFGKAMGGIAFKKAGLCKLEIAQLRAGRCAILEWLLTPKQLAAFR